MNCRLFFQRLYLITSPCSNHKSHNSRFTALNTLKENAMKFYGRWTIIAWLLFYIWRCCRSWEWWPHRSGFEKGSETPMFSPTCAKTSCSLVRGGSGGATRPGTEITLWVRLGDFLPHILPCTRPPCPAPHVCCPKTKASHRAILSPRFMLSDI